MVSEIKNYWMDLIEEYQRSESVILKIDQTGEEREKRWKKMSRTSGTSVTISKSLTLASGTSVTIFKSLMLGN